jgi:hypothetical protein
LYTPAAAGGGPHGAVPATAHFLGFSCLTKDCCLKINGLKIAQILGNERNCQRIPAHHLRGAGLSTELSTDAGDF